MVHDDTEKHLDVTPVDVNRLNGQLCEISISHDGDFATAVALVPTQAHNGVATVGVGGSSFETSSA